MTNAIRMWALCLAIGICWGCDVSVKSLDDPRLPRYSETGTNTAGCLINDVAWRKTCVIFLPLDACEGEDIDVDTIGQYTRLYLSGSSFDGESHGAYGAIYFDLLGLQFDSISEFMSLQGRSFAIDGLESKAGFVGHLEESSDCFDQPADLKGALYIHRAHVADYILENSQAGVEKRLSLSGTFAFTSEMLCGKFELSYGRFDVMVLARDLRRVP